MLDQLDNQVLTCFLTASRNFSAVARDEKGKVELMLFIANIERKWQVLNLTKETNLSSSFVKN